MSTAETQTNAPELNQVHGEELLKQLQAGWAPLPNHTIVGMVIGGLKIRLMRSTVTMVSVVLAIAFLSYTLLTNSLVANLVDAHDTLIAKTGVNQAAVTEANLALVEVDLFGPMPVEDRRRLATDWRIDDVSDQQTELGELAGEVRRAKVANDDAAEALAAIQGTAKKPSRAELEAATSRAEQAATKYEQLNARKSLVTAQINLGEWLRSGESSIDEVLEGQLAAELTKKREFLMPPSGERARLENEEIDDYAILLDLFGEKAEYSEQVAVLREAFAQEEEKRAATDIRSYLRTAGVSLQEIRAGDTMGTWLIVMALLTCTVGIANAMLMSVTERFREIATMKCLGAQDSLVVKLFLLESGMLGIVGALLGIVVGVPVALLAALLQYGGYGVTYFPWSGMPMAILWSVLAGILLAVGGAVAPAIMAARFKPVDALRVDE